MRSTSAAALEWLIRSAARGSASSRAVALPSRQQALDRLPAPLVPVDFLPRAQQAADHVAQARQAELHHQFEHRLVALGQAEAELAVDQLVEEGVGLGLVEDLEAGIDARLHGVRPQERPAERVDGADPRRVELADEAEPVLDLLFGCVAEPLEAGLADAVAHFPRRPLGKGDGRQLVQPRGAVVAAFLRPAPRRGGIAR